MGKTQGNRMLGFGFSRSRLVEVHLTSHVIEQYLRRVCEIDIAAVRASIYADIEHGYRCEGSRRKRWHKAGVFTMKTSLDVMVESADRSRLYVLSWSNGKLFVRTVLTVDVAKDRKERE